jgi:transposase
MLNVKELKNKKITPKEKRSAFYIFDFDQPTTSFLTGYDIACWKHCTIFLFEVGHGNIVDENGGPEPMKYIVDQNEFIVEPIATHSEHLKNMPSSESSSVCPMLTEKPKDEDIRMKEVNTKRDYVRYSLQDKARFFDLKIEKCMSASAAAKQLGIHIRTAQRWVKQYNMCPDSIFEVCKQIGRKCILSKEHKTAVINFIDSNPSASVVEVTEHLLNPFDDLKVSRSTVYNFMKGECNLSLKKADFHSVERNSPAKVEERHDWVRKWKNTDMNFLTNCMFLDESAFDINMKCSRAWFQKGTRAIVTRPVTRANTTLILGAISAEVMGHYISFLKMTLDEMNKHPHMKGYYVIMDNAPIHTHENIKKYIEYRGYKCAYLPTYSPELNPIEQFWAVAKSKVKRHRFLQEDTLSKRITEACNSVEKSYFKGFVSHSYNSLDKCRNKLPI